MGRQAAPSHNGVLRSLITLFCYCVNVPRPKQYDDGLADRIIDAAGRLLLEEGPHALSTRRVAMT